METYQYEIKIEKIMDKRKNQKQSIQQQGENIV